MRMQWFLLRHAYFIKGEDFAVAVALLDLALYVLIGTNSLQFLDQSPEKALFGMITSALIFIIALCGFVIVRMFRTSKYKIETYIMPVLIICNIASVFYMQLINKLVGFMTLQLPVLTFLITGYPYVWLVAFVLIGMGGGLIAQSVVCSVSLGSSCPPSVWVDVGLYALQLISGSVAYFTVYELGILIVRYKRHPARYLDAFSDLTALDTIVFSPVFGLGGETARQVQVNQLMAPEKPNLDGLTFLRSASQVSQTTNRIVSRAFYHANTPPHSSSRDALPADKALGAERSDRAGSAVFSPNTLGPLGAPSAGLRDFGPGRPVPGASVVVPKSLKQHAAALHAGANSPHGSPPLQPHGALPGAPRSNTLRGCSGQVSLVPREEESDPACGSLRASVESKATHRSAATLSACESKSRSGRVAGLFRGLSKRPGGPDCEEAAPAEPATSLGSKELGRKKTAGSKAQSSVPILLPRPQSIEETTWRGLASGELSKDTPVASLASRRNLRMDEQSGDADKASSDVSRDPAKKGAGPFVAEAPVHTAVLPSSSFHSEFPLSRRDSGKELLSDLRESRERTARAASHDTHAAADDSGLQGDPALAAEARVRTALHYHRRWFFSQLFHFRRARRRHRRGAGARDGELVFERGEPDEVESEESCDDSRSRPRETASLSHFSRLSRSRRHKTRTYRRGRSSDGTTAGTSDSDSHGESLEDEGSDSGQESESEESRRRRMRSSRNRRRETSSEDSSSGTSVRSEGRHCREGRANSSVFSSGIRRYFSFFSAATRCAHAASSEEERPVRPARHSWRRGSGDSRECSASTSGVSEACEHSSDASWASSSSLCGSCEKRSIRMSRRRRREGKSRPHASSVSRAERHRGHVSVDLAPLLPSRLFFDTFLNSVRRAERLSKEGRLPASVSRQSSETRESRAAFLNGDKGCSPTSEAPERSFPASANEVSFRRNEGWERYYDMLLPSLPPFPSARPLYVKPRKNSQAFQNVAVSVSRNETEMTASSPATSFDGPRAVSLSPEGRGARESSDGGRTTAPSDLHSRPARAKSLVAAMLHTYPTCPQPPSDLSLVTPPPASPSSLNEVQASRSSPARITSVELGALGKQQGEAAPAGTDAVEEDRDATEDARGSLSSPTGASRRGDRCRRSWSSYEARSSVEMKPNLSIRDARASESPLQSAAPLLSEEKKSRKAQSCAQCRRCGRSRTRLQPSGRLGSSSRDDLVGEADSHVSPEKEVFVSSRREKREEQVPRSRREERRDRRGRRWRRGRRRRKARECSETEERRDSSSEWSGTQYSSQERRSHEAVGGVAQLTPICVDDECGKGDAGLSPLLRSEAEESEGEGDMRERQTYETHSDGDVEELSEEEREDRGRSWLRWLFPWGAGEGQGGEKNRRKRSRSEGRREREFISAERRYLEHHRRSRVSSVADSRWGSGSEASADAYPALRRRKGSRVYPVSKPQWFQPSGLTACSSKNSWLAVPPDISLVSAAPALPTPSPSSLSFSGLDQELDCDANSSTAVSSSLPDSTAWQGSGAAASASSPSLRASVDAHFAEAELHAAEHSDGVSVSPRNSPGALSARPMSAAGMPNPDSGIATQTPQTPQTPHTQRPLLLAQSLVAASGKPLPPTRADFEAQRSQGLGDLSQKTPRVFSPQGLGRSQGYGPGGSSYALDSSREAGPSGRLSATPSTRLQGSGGPAFPHSSFPQAIGAAGTPTAPSRDSRTFFGDTGAARASRAGLSGRLASRGTALAPKGTRRLKSGYSVGAADAKDKQKGKVLRYQLVQKFHDRLPWWVARIIVYTDAALENCRRRRRLMQRATWKTKVAMPVRNMLGLFSDEKIETWYVQWLNAFNAKYYPRVAWLLFLICFYATAFHGLLRLRGFIENYPLCIDAVRASPLGEAGFLILVAVRFASQPILSFLLLLPLLRHSGSRLIDFLSCSRAPATPLKSYKLYRWMLALSFLQFVYAVFDNTWHLIAEPGSRHVNPLTIIPASPSLEIAAVQTVYILAVRTPTINLIFLLYIITYIIIFFVALPPGVQQVQLFTISMAGWLFTCVGGQLFYTRAFEVNRRRLFCKYVLPYMLYLEEIAAILYSNPQGEYPLDEGSEDEVSMGSGHLVGDRSA
ncbi:putative transmembrane protein [Toxoplasma gondii RUB]|uniref:Putative transmembrane protein n=1 Tax=Toxoplasma gondii RUB TaxID=935652 RepID=A0A086LJU0_TOXGO|nr:putative transmembrane protein [Toxoplasma gondii RUB]